MATDGNPPDAGLLDHDPNVPDHAPDDMADDATTRTADREDADTCRICRGEGSAEEPLFFPCKCSGSIKYVHQECLMEWLSHTQKKHCELCKTSFRFTKLYHPSMPNRIPTTVFVRRAALHVLNMFISWCRGVLVATVWLFLLPWCMRVVWRSLFWVGDGGWTREMLPDFINPTDTPRLSQQDMASVRSAVEAAKANNATQNLTLSGLLVSISYSPRNTSLPDSPLWAFAKRVIFGTPYPFSPLSQFPHFQASESNQTVSNTTSSPLGTRAPSLLSDVPFFHWFSSQAANRFIIDVLEGQIITLFVVVAFILIFLIREWVVQQQPVINMVALGELGEHAAAEAAVQEVANQEEDAVEAAVEEAFGEGARDDIDGAEAAATINENLPAPNPLFRQRRASSITRGLEEDLRREEAGEPSSMARTWSTEAIATEYDGEPSDLDRTDNLDTATSLPMSPSSSNDPNMFPSNTLHIPSNSAPFPARSSSLPRPKFLPDDFDSEALNIPQRPNMPTRDRSFIATGIRRSLEEGNSWSFDQTPQSTRPEDTKAESVPESWDDKHVGDHLADHAHEANSDHDPESEHSSESWQQVSDVTVEDDSDQALEGEGPRDKGKARAVDDTIEPLANNTASSVGGDDIEADPPTDDDEFSISSSEDVSEGHEDIPVIQEQEAETRMNESAANEAPAAPAEFPEEPQLLNRFLDWMFGDIAPAAQAGEEGANDEHIVRNLAEEAPFVPFVGNEPRDHGNAPARDPEVAAAAAQAGIDVNDQEAIEDAEDLEGILELIGMQGPLIGLFQNALFSAVLISATLTCAVWLPYLWGKVVILFVGSPVSLFVKLPLRLIATTTDLIADVTLFVVAGATYWVSQLISIMFKLCSWGKFSESVEESLRALSGPAHSLAENALDRIAKLIVESPLSPRPDYFRLSISSHAALRSLQNSTSSALNETSNFVNNLFEKASADSPPTLLVKLLLRLPLFIQTCLSALYSHCSTFISWLWASKSYKITFNLDLGQNTAAAYNAMEYWTASDRMIAIFAGYGFFAMAGAVYLKRGTPFSSSPNGQRIERIVSDILQQAGGVLKVILIISIEMLAFPLYCGLLLDLAMLPLFKNATLYTRWQFARESPWTSGFVHWFIGTCYMFHFALFVSMCRKIMRKGVLYFIRDPDDPTFHPVRDVLERSVTTQLRKIAFSALVYGALVIICLGGVVWTLSRATSEVLPIHWTTDAPSLEFPLDLLFYNFLTPIIIKFYKPSESLHSVYQWWFKRCASFLRLTNFLFGEKAENQEGEDGRYVRAPASDQARIPKGQPVFVDVDKHNVRKDGITEGGVHNSDLVAMVYIPSWFRVRILAFVVTIWIFMGMSGISVTILPLLFGRYLFSFFLPPTVEMNDIHAFSLGVYSLGSLAYSAYHVYKLVLSLNRVVPDPMSTLQTIATTTSRVGLRVLRFAFVWTSLIFVIPLLFAVLIELYFLMPLHAYLGPAEPHVVHFIQDWTLGFLYFRLCARLVFANRASRPARAFAAVVRDGYLAPNARIATRCFLLPVTALFLVAIAVPSSLALLASNTLYWGAGATTKNMLWRFSFPVVGVAIAATWMGREAVRLLIRWRLVIRDEVYLIGERLHNFGERRARVGREVAGKDAVGSEAGKEGVFV
ncbi:RING finger membrane protein [Pyrenochaeta sp. DS3sAY3a]|nr:RING finger membrane protein [Pyrenochaeta sp. DS3sAY3a]